MKRAYLLVFITALAACGRPNPIAHNEQDAALLPAPKNDDSPDPDGAPPANAVAAAIAEPAPAATVPVALRGRWGLTPVDCTTTRGDAKGLLVVSAGKLQFYESRAVPVSEIETTQSSIAGNFRFEGEGETWMKFESLQLQERKLVRIESKPAATFTYARC
jgi:hypothetical protein